MRRDRNGRFSKASDEGVNVSFNIPSLKTIIYWIVFIVFLMPWIIIVQRSDAFGTLFNIFEDLMGVNSNDSTEQSKKMEMRINQKRMDYFIKWSLMLLFLINKK